MAHGDISFQEVIGAVCTTRSRAYTPIAQATITIHEEGQCHTCVGFRQMELLCMLLKRPCIAQQD